MNTALLIASIVTHVSPPDRYGVRTMTANIECNRNVKANMTFPITADSFASVKKHGFFQVVLI